MTGGWTERSRTTPGCNTNARQNPSNIRDCIVMLWGFRVHSKLAPPLADKLSLRGREPADYRIRIVLPVFPHELTGGWIVGIPQFIQAAGNEFVSQRDPATDRDALFPFLIGPGDDMLRHGSPPVPLQGDAARSREGRDRERFARQMVLMPVPDR